MAGPLKFNPTGFGMASKPVNPVKTAPASKGAVAGKTVGFSTAKKPAPKPLTQQQIALQTVNQSLSPILQSLTGQEKSLGQEQAASRQALKDFTNQIMQYISGIPGQAAGSYNEAINTTNNLAQTAATGLANLNPQSQNDALLSAIGAPDAQKAALAAQNQQAFGGGGATLYNVAGAIPATQIATDKANQLAYYQGLPAVAGLQGTQAMRQLLFTQAKDKTALRDKFAEIQAKRPGLVQESLASMQDAQLQQQQAQALADYRVAQAQTARLNAQSSAEYKAATVELNKAKAEQDAIYKHNTLALGQTKAQQDAAYKQDRLSLDAQKIASNEAIQTAKLNQSAAKLNLQAEQWAARFKLDTQKVDIQERKLKASKASKGKRGFTAKQVVDLRKDASAFAKEARLGWTDKDGVFHPPVAYQQVLADMTGAGIPLTLAQQALARYWRPGAAGIKFQKTNGPEGGFYYFPEDVTDSGIAGRPKIPFQLRKR